MEEKIGGQHNVCFGVKVKNHVGKTEMEGQPEETAHQFPRRILNSQFMKWVVPLPTLEHNRMYPVIFTEFDLHAAVSGLPPAALEEDIETIVLSKDSTTSGQTDMRSHLFLSLACRHLQTHSVLRVQCCVLNRAEDTEAPSVV